MSIVVGIGLALGGYTLGFVAAGLLLRGCVQDLRRLLETLLDHPDDENIRGLVRATLGIEE
jgi:hypothetical protein